VDAVVEDQRRRVWLLRQVLLVFSTPSLELVLATAVAVAVAAGLHQVVLVVLAVVVLAETLWQLVQMARQTPAVVVVVVLNIVVSVVKVAAELL
jgi:hypothetical protein